jgi:cytochrome c oxidase cbb3-type subunit III
MKNENKTELDVRKDEEHLLIDHNYDGIQELNHPLPSWWNIIFWVAIAYSIGYFVYYQFLSGPSLREEFNVNYATVLEKKAEFARLNSAFNHDTYNQTVTADGVKKGLVVFETNCLPCHSDGGKGDIGPNLTDEYWLIAKSTPETIYNVAFKGSEENGMPAWGELLTKEELYQAVAYVSSLKNTKVKGGKAPQGTKIDD